MSREGFVILKVKIEEEALINDTYQATKKSKMNDLKVVGMYDIRLLTPRKLREGPHLIPHRRHNEVPHLKLHRE